MNEHEAARIAASIHQLRPDWPVASLNTLIAKNLIERPRRDVAVALAWVACEPQSLTPARVLEAGPWWQAVAADAITQPAAGRPPKREEACQLCGRHLGGCACGRRLVRPDAPATPEIRQQYLDQIRASLGGGL